MGKTRWLGGLLLAGCTLSLLDAGPVRSAEELLAPALTVLDGPLTAWLPGTDDGAWLAALREPAARAFHAHAQAVLGDVRAAGPGRVPLLVPVLGREQARARHELLVAIPGAGVERGAIVCAGGALLGFVKSVDQPALRATVALLGDGGLRAVAAQWTAVAGGRPVDVLASGGAGPGGLALRLTHPSSRVSPAPGQHVLTRDVSALGDPLPAGLVLGRVDDSGLERPGGGAGGGWGGTSSGLPEEPLLEPLRDPLALPLVTVEAAPGSELTARVSSARLSGLTRSADRLRLDAGSSAGVQAGDWVLQDGLFVGIVDVVAPWSALVSRAVPPGTLLVMSLAGEVVCADADRASWPPGWEPARNDLLATGSVLTGGLVVGRVAGLDEDGLQAQRLQPDPQRSVQVVGP